MDRPTSPIFDANRMITYGDDVGLKVAYYQLYTMPQDIAGARWLRSYIRSSDVLCAGDASRLHVLLSYGERPTSTILLSQCDFRGSYVYFGVMNTRFEIGAENGNAYDISSYLSIMSARNRLYFIGGTMIYGPT